MFQCAPFRPLHTHFSLLTRLSSVPCLSAPPRLPGKDLSDPRVLTDAGDVPVQEMRSCGVTDERLMRTVSDSVLLVMNEVRERDGDGDGGEMR